MKLRELSEIIINGVTLEKILEDHKKWLNNEGGKRANLSYADLSDADLSSADLRHVYLIGANLSDTDLSYADLRNANLRHANLSSANLRHANLSSADLRYANLSNADLINADLKEIKYDNNTCFIQLQCPEEGSFIGYKKADNKIVKLLITEDAKRSSATSRKCRCSKAKVLIIKSLDEKEEYNEVASDRDKNFIYKVGEIVEVKDFDENRWNECSIGIHFFITRDETVNY